MNSHALIGITAISAASVIAIGTITVTTGNTSSTSGSIQTQHETVSNKNEVFQVLHALGQHSDHTRF